MNNSKRRKMSDGIRSSVKIKKTRRKTHSFSNAKKEQDQLSRKRKVIKKSIPHTSSNEKPIFTKKLKIKRKRNFLSTFSQNKKIKKRIFFVIVFFSIIAFFLQKNEKTTIEIIPHSQDILENKKVTAFLHPKFNELGFGVIALSETGTKTIEPKERVKLSKKASGKIKIFNNYSTEPQKLSPYTRFRSVSGKLFKLDEKMVIIPGKSADGPGEIEVSIYADQTGPEYNIDVTDFSIPGFKESGLTDKYNNIYALSLKKFSGGENGYQFVLSDKQKKETQNILESELKETLIKKLEREKTDKIILVDNSVQILFKEPLFKKVSEGYLVEQKTQIFAVFIEKKQLEKFLKKTYLPKVDEKEIVLSDFKNISFNYTGGEIDFNHLKSIKINALLNTKFIWNIDTKLVAESLQGLGKKDISTILRELDEIESAIIHIHPFWQNHVSDNLNRIDIKLK